MEIAKAFRHHKESTYDLARQALISAVVSLKGKAALDPGLDGYLLELEDNLIEGIAWEDIQESFLNAALATKPIGRCALPIRLRLSQSTHSGAGRSSQNPYHCTA